MALDFPNSPTVGALVTGATGVSYRWDGTKWTATGSSGVSSFNTRQGAVTLNAGDVTTVLPGSSLTPIMDGTAAIGTGTTWARADHVHPTDNTRMPIVGNPGGNAAPGNVGEYISSNVGGPGASLTSNTPLNATSISLTAGDWDVWATVGFTAGSGTVGSAYWGTISSISVTLNPSPGTGGAMVLAGNFVSGLSSQCLPVGTLRASLAAPGTYYLVGQALFSGGTMQLYGFIGARRVR